MLRRVAVLAVGLLACVPEGGVPGVDTASALDKAGRPDLVVAGWQVDPPSPRPGEPVTLGATIANVGNAATPRGVAVGVGARLDDAYAGAFFVRDARGSTTVLPAGARYSGTITTVALDAGRHRLCVFVDDVNRVSEQREDNNSGCVEIEVAPPDRCTHALRPEDFGTPGGARTPWDALPANARLADPSCERVRLELAPGAYVFDPDSAHAGIDLRGGGRDAEIVFSEGEYVFNHELFFTHFSGLTIQGAGPDRTRLRFCQRADCRCPDADAGAPGCQLARRGWGMLHLRLAPQRVRISGLSLEGADHEAREFDVGIALAMDGSTPEDVVIQDVAITRARYGVMSKNSLGLVVANARLREAEIGVLFSSGPHRRVLVHDVEIDNPDKLAGPRYGVFATGPLIDSILARNRIARVAERGIYLGADSARVWIHGNLIEDAGVRGTGAGINLGKEGLSDILVSDNVIRRVGDGGPTGALGGLPITRADDLAHDPASRNVRGTTTWPNLHWNGYGIQTSGATGEGAIAIVGNVIEDASTHGILVDPGADAVAILDNRIERSGVNGVSVVPGYAYEGQFGYVEQGPTRDIWIQGNTIRGSGRAGVEILPRGQPLLAVACTQPDGCRHAHNPYPLCSTDPAAPLCADRYDPLRCGEHCYDPADQGYDVRLHDNLIRDSGLAELVIDPFRVPGAVEASYAITAIEAPGRVHLEPTGPRGGRLPPGCTRFVQGRLRASAVLSRSASIAAHLAGLRLGGYDVGARGFDFSPAASAAGCGP